MGIWPKANMGADRELTIYVTISLVLHTVVPLIDLIKRTFNFCAAF